jgi:intracellular multiplication protein IcmT
MMNPDYSRWLDAGRPATILKIPVLVYMVFLLIFIWPGMNMFIFCFALLIFYKILSLFGLTLTILLQRILHRLRGNIITGRPWWYRKFFE